MKEISLPFGECREFFPCMDPMGCMIWNLGSCLSWFLQDSKWKSSPGFFVYSLILFLGLVPVHPTHFWFATTKTSLKPNRSLQKNRPGMATGPQKKDVIILPSIFSGETVYVSRDGSGCRCWPYSLNQLVKQTLPQYGDVEEAATLIQKGSGKPCRNGGGFEMGRDFPSWNR